MVRNPVRAIALVCAVLVTACGDATSPDLRLLPQGQIVSGHNHNCFLNLDGQAWCWGWGRLGQMGNGDTLTQNRSPVKVSGPVRFMRLTAASNHTCGLDPDGAGYCWGSQVYGELGTGITSGVSSRPVPVQGGHVWIDITAGDDGHTCGITVANEPYCWGLGLAGQLGTGDTQDRALPTPVSTSVRFSQISAGLLVTCGVAEGGQAYCWGSNDRGQLGNGTVGGNSNVPLAVMGATRFQSISVGHFVVCGVSVEQDAFCWGSGTFGRLGTGEENQGPIPTPSLVANGLKYDELAVAATHTCAVTLNRQGFCWGLNTYGKLGDDVGPSSLEPTQISGGLALLQAGVGNNHSCGLTVANDVYCWGNNIIGQLGVPGQRDPTFTPLLVYF